MTLPSPDCSWPPLLNTSFGLFNNRKKYQQTEGSLLKGNQNVQGQEHLPCGESLWKRHPWEDLAGAPDAYKQGVEEMDQGVHASAHKYLTCHEDE